MRRMVLVLSLWVIGTVSDVPAGLAEDAPRDPASLAIVDISYDIGNEAQKLYANGVRVVGRYMGRCHQWEGKLIGCNSKGSRKPGSSLANLCEGQYTKDGSELDLLFKAGLSVFSIYQYNNDGKFIKPGYRKNKDGGFEILKDKNCLPQPSPHSMKKEAELDAEAALAQANFIGQPDKTAIYFGVDFDADSDAVDKNVKDYFTVIRKKLSPRFLIGAYGNGRALSLLVAPDNPRDKLIDLAWINASPAHASATEFFNGMRWHMLQTRTDVGWFSKLNIDPKLNNDKSCSDAVILDTDVQNPAMADEDLGFWRRSDGINKIFKVEPARTKAIASARRFFCNGSAQLTDSNSKQKAHFSCREVDRKKVVGEFPMADPYGRTLRATVNPNSNRLVAIDIDDDGIDDGWTLLRNISAWTRAEGSNVVGNRPQWMKTGKQRMQARCPP